MYVDSYESDKSKHSSDAQVVIYSFWFLVCATCPYPPNILCTLVSGHFEAIGGNRIGGFKT